jgi:hypothetical protein
VEEVNAAVTPSDATPKTVDLKKDRINSFATLSQADINQFASIVGEANVISEIDEIAPFVKDFTNKYVGIGSIVITPSTTEQISECLKYCNERRLAVVP